MTNKNRTVLIIEDEKPLSHALELKLGHAGFNTIVADNGEEGLAKLESEQVDLVILDLIMPKMDGFDFLEKMKGKVPVFVLSNLSQDEDVTKAKELGVEEFFIKSNIQIAKVVEKVEAALK